jgi:hypothetical protein
MDPLNLSHVLPDNAWHGQRCFCIGGGPSLKGFDFSRLRGELVIGINKSYEVVDSALLFTMDKRFLDWANSGQFGPESWAKWQALKTTRVFHRNVPHTSVTGCRYIERTSTDKLTTSIRAGFCGQNNSGFGALNLALCLGCSEIYLLGYDMTGNRDTGKQAHFHSGYPTMQAATVYNDMLALFGKHADEIKRYARVINCNPSSALRCFEFGALPEDRKERPVVVGYYTRGTGYEAEFHEMAASAHRMGLEVDGLGIDSMGGWQRNTQYKATFLRDMVRKHWGKTIVYTDADSRFLRYPGLLDESSFRGIRYRLRRGKELLSGTLQIHCDESTASLMDRWVSECENNPRLWDQKTLEIAASKWTGQISEFPYEYCTIFDDNDRPAEPVIVHNQASRKLKQEVGA